MLLGPVKVFSSETSRRKHITACRSEVQERCLSGARCVALGLVMWRSRRHCVTRAHTQGSGDVQIIGEASVRTEHACDNSNPSLLLRGTSSASLWPISCTSRPSCFVAHWLICHANAAGALGWPHMRGQHSLNRSFTCSTNVIWESLPRLVMEFC